MPVAAAAGAHRYCPAMPSVLVTGAARGIGRATVARLAADGLGRPTPASATRHGASPGATTVALDITDAEHLAALPEALPARLDAVVNNAGIAISGPVEALPLDEWRRQLEVNLIGQVAVTQAVLPRLRESRGRIVFVSSLSGRVATPMTGAYNASKFALEGMADALRMELRPWGVRVVLVEPAQTDTDMWRTAEAGARRRPGEADARPPRALRQAHRRRPQDDPALAEDGLAGGSR